MSSPPKDIASSGHLLGQLVGDWWERYVVKPLMEEVASELQLYADCRFKERSCRGAGIQWPDASGNTVDYDFVLELGGTDELLGTPVAFLESFWRRGSRHSKDKARDDTNKLLPMSDAYPTARFLAIAACGEFTEPARDYVRSRGVYLFLVPKARIVAAFLENGVQIDYPDSLAEDLKREIALNLQSKASDSFFQEVTRSLRNLVGHTAFRSFSDQIRSSLSAPPQSLIIRQARKSDPVVFESIREASDFLSHATFEYLSDEEVYYYKIVYSDGSQFVREFEGLNDLKATHYALQELVSHMERISARNGG